MMDSNSTPDIESDTESFPVEPRYHPVNRILRAVYDFMASSKLAMFLLIAILICCVIGVTVLRERSASEMIFGTLWFSALLVLLVANVACCFFGRIWYRKLTMITFGMILFHLSFVTMFAGIIYDSLFKFEGIIRLTEGESLQSGDPQSYDLARQGRFFNFQNLKGSTTLNSMQTKYNVDGLDKTVAYDVTIGTVDKMKQGIVFITHHLDYDGFRYFRDKEGYSVLLVISDKQGRELTGAFIPLQSYRQKDNSFIYASGNKDAPSDFNFPQDATKPLYNIQFVYHPSKLSERGGDVSYKVRPYRADNVPNTDTPLAEGTVAVGSSVPAGENLIVFKEVRYWAAMNVRYDPGQSLVLLSLWVGLGGMIITMAGRIMRQRSHKTV